MGREDATIAPQDPDGNAVDCASAPPVNFRIGWGGSVPLRESLWWVRPVAS